MALGASRSGGASGEAAQGDGTAWAETRSGGGGAVLDDGQRGEHPGSWSTCAWTYRGAVREQRGCTGKKERKEERRTEKKKEKKRKRKRG